jgi:hypothetical protein
VVAPALALSPSVLSSVLPEPPQLRGRLGLAVPSYPLALPLRRVSSGRLGGLAAVAEEARGPGEVGDDGQKAPSAAARTFSSASSPTPVSCTGVV